MSDLAVTKLREELQKREKYWRDWNGKAANRNAKLEAKIEALENPWISVDERLPEDTQAVLAWVPNNLCYYMVTLRPNGEWSSWQGDYRYWWCEFITHWMPLPIPPGRVMSDLIDEVDDKAYQDAADYFLSTIETLEARIEALENPSWKQFIAGAEKWLTKYPPDIFDGSSGDPGPLFIVAFRKALADLPKGAE